MKKLIFTFFVLLTTSQAYATNYYTTGSTWYNGTDDYSLLYWIDWGWFDFMTNWTSSGASFWNSTQAFVSLSWNELSTSNCIYNSSFQYQWCYQFYNLEWGLVFVLSPWYQVFKWILRLPNSEILNTDISIYDNALYTPYKKYCFYLDSSSNFFWFKEKELNEICENSVVVEWVTLEQTTINSIGNIPNITPPVWPITYSINGLTCESKPFPDLYNVSWYNIGSWPVKEDLSNTWSVRLKVSASTWSTRDYDLISISKSSENDINPTIIPFWSLPYPGSLTEEATIRSDWYLNISSYASWALRTFNLIQMNAIWYLEWWSSVSLYIWRSDWTSSIWSKSWTWTDLTIWFPTYANRIWIKYLNAFNWIRIWSAPFTLKTSCYKNFNVCKWVINSGISDCVAGTAVNWIYLWQCSIAGSWSVYGSWSCVPTVDSSWNIIPPSPMAWWYVTLDASGAIVWTVNPPIQEQNQEEINSIFSCWFSDDDSWYKTLWNWLTCPVTVVWNIFNSAWDNISKTVNGISRINSVTNNIGFTWSESQHFTWSTNVIGNKLAEKFEDIGDSTKWVTLVGKIYKMAWWALFVWFIVVAVIWTIIFLIKSKND